MFDAGCCGRVEAPIVTTELRNEPAGPQPADFTDLSPRIEVDATRMKEICRVHRARGEVVEATLGSPTIFMSSSLMQALVSSADVEPFAPIGMEELCLLVHLHDHIVLDLEAQDTESKLAELESLNSCFISSLMCCPLSLGLSICCYLKSKHELEKDIAKRPTVHEHASLALMAELNRMEWDIRQVRTAHMYEFKQIQLHLSSSSA